MRKTIILFINFILLSLFLLSQEYENGIPSFKNLSPIMYGQESQNFSILQDKNHLMFFGNVNGIMEYDNSEWRLIPVAGRPMMDINNKNEIFFGGYNEIGKLIYENGVPKEHLYSFHKEINPGQISQVVALDDIVFFATSHQLLSLVNDSVEVELSNIQGIKIFKLNQTVYISVPERGLYTWGDDKVQPVENNHLLSNNHVEDVCLLGDGRFLIKPRNEKGFLIFDGKNLEIFRTEVDDFIERNMYSKSRVLYNGHILIGTHLGGLVCINEQGRFVFVLNRDNGLRDNQITDIFVDNNHKVWITTFNGITIIETPSAFSFFDATFGLNGAVLSIYRKDGNLYVSTITGAYKYYYEDLYDNERFEINSRKRFEKIEGINTLTWQLVEINNKLYAASLSGLFEIIGKRAKKVLEGQYNAIYQSSLNPEICFIGSTEGLLLSNITPTGFDTIGYVSGLNYNIRSISEDDDGTVWLGTNADGLFRLNFRGNYSTSTGFVNYNENNAFPEGFNWVDVYRKSFGTFFSTQKGLFYYSPKRDVFEFDTSLGYDFDLGDRYLYPIIEDQNKNIWFSCTFTGKYFRETGVALFDKKTSQHTRKTEHFALIQEFPIEAIYADKEGVIWFGSTESLIKYQHEFVSPKKSKSPCLIRKITIRNDSVIYLDPDYNLNELHINMLFSDKTIRFDFSYLQYNTYGENEFQVFLEGFDSDWSEWSKESFKEYTALSEREYTFRIRARDIYGNVSEDTMIKFRVKPPIYRTIYAYLFYIIAFALFIYLILKYNELRYAKERFGLEKLVQDRTNELAYQKEQTEKLVKKLLPGSTVDEITQTGKAKSQKYEMVSVLFADIQGFTKIADEVAPEELIKHLNSLFSAFDSIIANYNIQKIKTIGDAYMCAGGMPNADNTNPIEVVLAGLEIQNAIELYNQSNKLQFHVRVGIHSGPVVAGVVGSNKLEYDIWGDTVNIASRMESHGVINKINVSDVTYNYIQDFFECEHRGKIEIKYKGKMDMFFINSIKLELANEDNPSIPNKDFLIKLQHIKLKAIQEEILDQLEKNLPNNLYYHNLKHTLNVLFIVENLARKEKVSEEELLLLKCAALFHDAGFMVSYDNNEEIGAKMAAQTLRKYKFYEEQIDTVERLILSTKMPPKPKDLLEKIICDADLDYLGRPDFIPISQNLFRELFERGKINTIEQWNKMQYKFMLNHEFFTETARKKREPIKKMVLEELKNLI